MSRVAEFTWAFTRPEQSVDPLFTARKFAQSLDDGIPHPDDTPPKPVGAYARPGKGVSGESSN